ncbi:MAG TPA: hypothetical protein VFB95_06920 [Candidatus Cryosericum sp.]|nr:hypothetical protein [Candidatus Cryosericum sp.]
MRSRIVARVKKPIAPMSLVAIGSCPAVRGASQRPMRTCISVTFFTSRA